MAVRVVVVPVSVTLGLALVTGSGSADAAADRPCVVVVAPGDSLSLIAERIPDPSVTVSSIQAENGISDVDVIEPGQRIDVCVGNGVDDVSGSTRQDEAVPADASGVEAQQRKLNELFAGLGIAELAVDGDSGPLTRQQLCAFRLARNLAVTRDDMVPGSDEEQLLMATSTLPIPPAAIVAADRWIVIDKTCQVMFAGERDARTVFLFATSTGEPGHETDNQDAVRAFRYDPALENGGWHNSTTFPVAADNPLNGNMYRPVYFFRGEAIHGANNVPPQPKSKGCARLRVENQDALIAWLGLGDAGGPVWNRDRINLTVRVQGEYVPDPAR